MNLAAAECRHLLWFGYISESQGYWSGGGEGIIQPLVIQLIYKSKAQYIINSTEYNKFRVVLFVTIYFLHVQLYVLYCRAKISVDETETIR